jgi:hypothetical protein
MFNVKSVAVNSDRTRFIYFSDNSTLHYLHNSEFFLICQEFYYTYLQKFQFLTNESENACYSILSSSTSM